MVGSGLLIAGLASAMLAGGPAGTFVGFDPARGQLPEGVAVAEDGDVFVSLPTLGELLRIPAGTDEAEPFGHIEGLAAGDLAPIGLAVDGAGNVYAGAMSLNPEANGVWRFDALSGESERIEGSEGIALANDVALADDGTLYITDTIAGSVWRAEPGGPAQLWVQDELLAGTGEAGFGFPLGANGIALADGVVYVSVTEKAHVVSVPVGADGSAGEVTLFARLPEAVDGIAIDEAGGLISAHPLADLITRWSPDGEIEVIADLSDGLDRPSTIALHVNDDGGTTAYVANFSVGMGTEIGNGPSILALQLDAGAAVDAGPRTLTVGAMDLWFDPAELTISADGATTVVLEGRGAVLHNLTVDALSLQVYAAPGTSGEATLVDPPAGTYHYYCSVYGHARAGMVGTLTIE